MCPDGLQQKHALLEATTVQQSTVLADASKDEALVLPVVVREPRRLHLDWDELTRPIGHMEIGPTLPARNGLIHYREPPIGEPERDLKLREAREKRGDVSKVALDRHGQSSAVLQEPVKGLTHARELRLLRWDGESHPHRVAGSASKIGGGNV